MGALAARIMSLFTASRRFTCPDISHFEHPEDSRILLAGCSLEDRNCPASNLAGWMAASAPFNADTAAKVLLTERLRPVAKELVRRTFEETASLSVLTAEWVCANPASVLVLMHALGASSRKEFRAKAQLTSMNSTRIGLPDARRMVDYILASDIVPDPEAVERALGGTIEGIVRDLVGKNLHEGFVERAFADAGIPFVREEDIDGIRGTVHSGRPDFVVPDARNPMALIEVRKAESNHASLYGHEKMLGAINWKDAHPGCIAIMVYAGGWNRKVLEEMESVFDYVIPVLDSATAARIVKAHLAGHDMRRRHIELKVTALSPPSLDDLDRLLADA